MVLGEELTMSKSNQNGVRQEPEVLVRLSRWLIRFPIKLRILEEVNQEAAGN